MSLQQDSCSEPRMRITGVHITATQRWLLYSLCVGCALLLSPEVHAQMVEDNQMASAIQEFHDGMRAFQARTVGLLTGTFWLLATIELAWSMTLIALTDQGLNGAIRELVIRIAFIGFFWALLINGIAWTDSIVATLTQLGSSAAGSGVGELAPDKIVDLGVNLMKRAVTNFSWRDMGTGIAMLTAATISFLALLLIAGNFALVLIEFYIVGFGGIWLLALGGSRWTHGYAVAYLKYALTTAARIFTMLVVAGVGYGILSEKLDPVSGSAASIDSMSQLWALAGFVVTLAIVATRAPDAVTGLLNGVNTSGSISAAQTLQAAAASAPAARNTATAGYAAVRSAGGAAIARVTRSAPSATVGRANRSGGGSVPVGKSPGNVFPSTGSSGSRAAAAKPTAERDGGEAP